MCLTEVNWRNVFKDHKSFPPDVQFVVTNKKVASSLTQQTFYCHKLLLSIVSPVFQSQFYGGGKDNLSGQIDVVINDCNPAAFEKMLEFIYFEKPFKLNHARFVEDSEGIRLVLDTMALAAKFKLKRLVTFCEETVVNNVIVTTNNYKDVQRLMKEYKNMEKLSSDLCRKFGSLVLTRLNRDQPNMEHNSKYEIVSVEEEMFRRGKHSRVMGNKRDRVDCNSNEAPCNKGLKSGSQSSSASFNCTPATSICSVSGSGPNVSIPPILGPWNSLHNNNNPLGLSQLRHSQPTVTPSPSSVLSNFRQMSSWTPRPVLDTSLESSYSFELGQMSFQPVSSPTAIVPPPMNYSNVVVGDLWQPSSSCSTEVVSANLLRSILEKVASSGVGEVKKQDLVLSREELKSLVLKFGELSQSEKHALLDYVKMMQAKDPEMMKWVKNQTKRN